ncbi:MAG: ATP-binding cassette domain-containing protein [Thermomicrobiales bacterium]
MTVEQDVALALQPQALRLPWASRPERTSIHQVLERLGIQTMAGRAVGELSGGQQQRLAMARAIINEPDLLLLEEPTSNLDVKTRDDLLGLLFELHASGTTIIMTTHAINNLAVHLPRLLCINGKLLGDGTPRQIFDESILSRTFETQIRIVQEDSNGTPQMIESGNWVPAAAVQRHQATSHVR